MDDAEFDRHFRQAEAGVLRDKAVEVGMACVDNVAFHCWGRLTQELAVVPQAVHAGGRALFMRQLLAHVHTTWPNGDGNGNGNHAPNAGLAVRAGTLNFSAPLMAKLTAATAGTLSALFGQGKRRRQYRRAGASSLAQDNLACVVHWARPSLTHHPARQWARLSAAQPPSSGEAHCRGRPLLVPSELCTIRAS